MTQAPIDNPAGAVIDALDALIADDTASLATGESAGAVIEALDALLAAGAAARQRRQDGDGFANRIQHVTALRDALEAADGDAGGRFRDLIDALNVRIDRLGILRDGLRRVADTQVEVGKRLYGLRSRLAESGS
ncbi:MAG: hypothetical protein F4Z89_13165 [Acidimicrobiaceae bacterium]|nr:hypothetical protein [Acidimicrobiaceae bacterium]